MGRSAQAVRICSRGRPRHNAEDYPRARYPPDLYLLAEHLKTLLGHVVEIDLVPVGRTRATQDPLHLIRGHFRIAVNDPFGIATRQPNWIVHQRVNVRDESLSMQIAMQ
jgi:hypothetical protein